MRNRNAVTRFVMLLVLLTMTLSVFVLPGAAKSDKPPGEGCSPAYWKNLKKHEDSWAQGYEPEDSFEEVFGVSPSIGGLKLIDALKANGREEGALWRHATAALLNAANPNVAYPHHLQTVISQVRWAYRTGNFEEVKDQFKAANKAGCPLK